MNFTNIKHHLGIKMYNWAQKLYPGVHFRMPDIVVRQSERDLQMVQVKVQGDLRNGNPMYAKERAIKSLLYELEQRDLIACETFCDGYNGYRYNIIAAICVAKPDLSYERANT